MAGSSFVGTPRRLALLFTLLAGVPVAGLGWLGAQFLSQQAEFERQQAIGQLQSAANLLVREVDRTLTEWEAVAVRAIAGSADRADAPAGTALFVLDERGVVHAAGVRLLYYPASAADDGNPSRFAEAHRAEFVEQNAAKATAAYRRLVDSRDETVRATALLGLARCLHRQGRSTEALQAYDELASLGQTTVAGSPAALVAHERRMAVFEAAREKDAVGRERALISTALSSARFRIDRATFDYYNQKAGSAPVAAADIAMAEAATELTNLWQRQPDGRTATSGAHPVWVVWRGAGRDARRAAVLGSTDVVLKSLAPLTADLGVDVSVSSSTTPSAVTRSLREIGLPVSLGLATVPQKSRAWLSQQQFFGLGFCLIALAVAGASYAGYRSVSREVAVARLQSDFVSAVSHEFRTPLTALRHFADVLEEGQAAPAQLPEYYHVLGKESRRLQALVENLLDFGRMESGERQYDFRPIDAAAFVRGIVEEFRERSSSNGREFELVVPEHEVPVRADDDALALALRNLIENAVKYSPDAPVVTVTVRESGNGVAIGVRDRGAGIPTAEQRKVFGKFVRGSAAERFNVKGTGIGLAMALKIVVAHGGSIELDSAPDQGSTFTMLLPAAAS